MSSDEQKPTHKVSFLKKRNVGYLFCFGPIILFILILLLTVIIKMIFTTIEFHGGFEAVSTGPEWVGILCQYLLWIDNVLLYVITPFGMITGLYVLLTCKNNTSIEP